jgi:hypothetical protein
MSMSSPLTLRPKRRQETRQARGAFGSQEVVAACHLEMDIMFIVLNPSISKERNWWNNNPRKWIHKKISTFSVIQHNYGKMSFIDICPLNIVISNRYATNSPMDPKAMLYEKGLYSAATLVDWWGLGLSISQPAWAEVAEGWVVDISGKRLIHRNHRLKCRQSLTHRNISRGMKPAEQTAGSVAL